MARGDSSPAPHEGGAGPEAGEGQENANSVSWGERLILELPPDADKEEVRSPPCKASSGLFDNAGVPVIPLLILTSLCMRNTPLSAGHAPANLDALVLMGPGALHVR